MNFPEKSTVPLSDKYFFWLSCLFAASLFFRHGVTHVLAALFIIGLVIFRPRIQFFKGLLWLVAFDAVILLSHFFGPYPGDGLEGGGMLYQWFLMFLPLCCGQLFDRRKLFIAAFIGCSCSAALMLFQWFIGVDKEASPFHIAWDGPPFQRPSGFNLRCWVPSFVHALFFVLACIFLDLKKVSTWIVLIVIGVGVVLPKVRGLQIATILAISAVCVYYLHCHGRLNKRRFFVVVSVLMFFCCSIILYRGGEMEKLITLNGRTIIWQPSLHVAGRFPLLGVGGGKHFKEEYQSSWDEMDVEAPVIFREKFGHTHNDWLMLAAHHGVFALMFYLLFLYVFMKYIMERGSLMVRISAIGVVSFHLLAGMTETYLDYSTTAYALFFTFGVILNSVKDDGIMGLAHSK